MSNLKITNVPLSRIHSYAQNAKKHSDAQIQKIANSIKEFGFNNPILIDESGEIIAGHGRFSAATLMGLETVPVIVLSHLTDAQKKAYRIADNKISETGGGWNEELLIQELKDLELDDNLDIQMTGFTTIEVDTMLNGKTGKGVTEKENIAPFVPDDEIVSKVGDLWQIGKHRLLCGSSLEESNFYRLMDGKLADIISQDPPFNIPAKTIGSSGKTKHNDFQMAAGEMTPAEFTQFLKDNFSLCSKYAKKTALSYQWMDYRHCREMLDAGETSFGRLVNICVWIKPTGGMGKLYRSQHEFCFVFSNGDNHYIDNVELGKHGRYRTNCWHYGSVGGFGVHKSDLVLHPTVKPYEAIKDLLLDASPRNGIVLDSFIGSGTSFVAAEKAKRICYGIELEPKYCDTAIRRMQNLFGIDAIHVDSGRTYSELLAEKLKNKGGNNG